MIVIVSVIMKISSGMINYVYEIIIFLWWKLVFIMMIELVEIFFVFILFFFYCKVVWWKW